MKPIYLTPGMGLSFDKATKGAAFEEYLSDPAKPVPYVRRPVRWDDQDQWRYWLSSDQRHVDGRPDVLTFVTEPLKAPLKISGEPVVNLFASTSGTDSDWVVKLIDVYPDAVPSDAPMGGYELGVAMEIFRGRYRESLEKPAAIPAGKVQKYRYELPPTNHVFKPGHRIMVPGPVQLVPALRPQSADLRAEHLLRQAVRLPQGDPAHLSDRGHRLVHRTAGGPAPVESYLGNDMQ